MKPHHYLKNLENIKSQFDPQSTEEKNKLLKILEVEEFHNPLHVKRYHDVLNFLFAYPDNKKIFSRVSRLLASFHNRSDLLQLKSSLVNSGIAGTDIEYQFYWPMARWLANKYPRDISILWDELDSPDKFMVILPLLLSHPESGVLDILQHLSPGECVSILKHKKDSDAVYIISCFVEAFSNDREREAIHDDINLSYKLTANKNTPSIANSRIPVKNIAYQSESFDRKRPELVKILKQQQFEVDFISRARGKVYIDLARKTMLTHERDLNAFSYGNPADVRCFNFSDGHQIIANSMVIERRYLLHSTYGFLNIRNGIPIGYFQIINLFNTAEIAFNLFSPFRGGETAKIFARNLAVAHQAFEVDTFILDPYQLGHGNEEGLLSGVWWFYYKLGFRPIDNDIIKQVKSELKKMSSRPGYRTSLSTLDELSSENLYYNINGDLNNCNLMDNLDYIPLGSSQYLSRESCSKKEQRISATVLSARQLTGFQNPGKMNTQQKLMWESWSPMLMNINGIKRWPVAERKKVADIINARSEHDEQCYVNSLNKHGRLKQGIINYANKLANWV